MAKPIHFRAFDEAGKLAKAKLKEFKFKEAAMEVVVEETISVVKKEKNDPKSET